MIHVYFVSFVHGNDGIGFGWNEVRVQGPITSGEVLKSATEVIQASGAHKVTILSFQLLRMEEVPAS